MRAPPPTRAAALPPPLPCPAAAELSPLLEELGVSWMTRKLIDATKIKWELAPCDGGFTQIVFNALGTKHYKYKVRAGSLPCASVAPPSPRPPLSHTRAPAPVLAVV